MKPKLEVRYTKKYGKGVFTLENIKKGRKITNLSGEKMSVDELIEKLKKGDEKENDPLQIGKMRYLDLDYLSRIFNHNCNPNAGLRRNNELFALRNIRKGEEITYDYSATIAPTLWSMKCKCGSRYCRKIIGDISTIPRKKIKRYEKMGALQNHVKSLLKSSEKNGKIYFTIPLYEAKAIEEFKKTAKK